MRIAAGLAAAILLAACAPPPAADRVPPPAAADVPQSMQPCVKCHFSIVESYLDHGMARSLGPVGMPEAGVVENSATGSRYEIRADGAGAWLIGRLPDGGERRQRLVGRIGAGIFDVSWVGAETDVVSGEATNRLFFAPVETVSGRGLELSPFEQGPEPAGMSMPLTAQCLTCHTDDDPAARPGAAAARTAAGPPRVFPPHALGVEAFDGLSPLSCAACHGRVENHLEYAAALARGERPPSLGLERLGALSPGRQRDVCARCHLQGEARFDLVGDSLRRDRPLAGQIPVVVPARRSAAFRFVGQLERLALSACFLGSPQLTCTSCHRPHAGVARQGVEAFDRACASCHPDCSRPEELRVEEVTGEAARSAAGCVDCHVRRSEPFDLPHVRSADHFIRRRIEPPESGGGFRESADPDGPLRLFDDGRLAAALQTPAGDRWLAGVEAMALATRGRWPEALERFASIPAPGSASQRREMPPAELTPLEALPDFHEIRGLVLVATGRTEEAELAFTDAIRLDPLAAGSRQARARLRLDRGDARGAWEDTEAILAAFPGAEGPWDLRLALAERTGRPDLAVVALRASLRAWPSNATNWYKLGLLLGQEGDRQGSASALERARRLRPRPPPGLVPAAPTR